MKKILTLLFLVSTFCLSAQTKVLFVGNSYTFMNDMTATFEAVSNANGSPVSVTRHALGGASLGDHVANTDLASLFQQGGWDFVVIQPKTAESTGNIPIETTLAHALTLKSAILEGSPCAKILFYQPTYGYLNPANPGNLAAYNSTMNTMRDNIHYLASETHSFFAPAGEAIRTIWNEDQSVNLWIASEVDQIHPNARGSYISACAIYDAIFQKNIAGNSYQINDISAADAIAYQTKVDDVVLNHLSDWLINTYNQHASFDFTISSGSIVHFKSTSVNYENLEWDFGDGTFSMLPEVTHNYTEVDNYTVTLKIDKNTCEELVSKEIAIGTVEVNNTEGLELNIFPNPCLEKFNIENLTSKKIKIYNATGQDCTPFVTVTKTLKGISVNIAHLPKGLYLLQTDKVTEKIQKL